MQTLQVSGKKVVLAIAALAVVLVPAALMVSTMVWRMARRMGW